MKFMSPQEEYFMTNFIKGELIDKYGYKDVEGKSYQELSDELARFRAKEVKVVSPHSSWF